MSRTSTNRSRVSRGLLAGAAACAVLVGSPCSMADQRDQMKRIFDRIAGVPPTESQIQEMLNAGSTVDAR